MGRSKVKRKGKYEKENGVNQSEQHDRSPDESFLDKLLKKADSLVEVFDYDLAKPFYKRALEQEPDNVRALESLASVHLELGEMNEAENLLLRAVSLCPDSGFQKYFSLAQMKSGKESLELYKKGIEAIKKQESTPQGSAQAQDSSIPIKTNLSNAYCAMAEIFMTDCCFEDEAESECQSCITNAIAADDSNPEAFQCSANYHLVKENIEEAKTAMEKSLSLWLPKYRESRESSQEEVETCLLSFDSRVNTSKLLTELEMFDEAAEILDGLIDEDDEQVMIWYMLGVLNHLRGEIYFGNARFYLKKALEVSEKTGGNEEFKELIVDMKEILSEVGPGSDDEEPEGNSDEEYETMSEEEMET